MHLLLTESVRKDTEDNRYEFIRILIKGKDNILCPIKLILILALRLGNVAGTTLEDVLAAAHSRQDKEITWLHPNRPVLCAFRESGTQLIVEQAASHQQLHGYLADVGKQAGIVATIRPHDLRYGAARDIRQLYGDGRVPVDEVGARLGHSRHSIRLGTTSRYIGPETEDYWTKRVEADFQDPFGLMHTDNPFSFSKVTSKEIDEICANQGLDAKNPAHRQRARLLRKSSETKEWIQSEKARLSKDAEDEDADEEDG